MEHLFTNIKEAREIIEEWRIDYNTNRPHSSLNGLTPIEFAARPTPGHNRDRSLLINEGELGSRSAEVPWSLPLEVRPLTHDRQALWHAPFLELHRSMRRQKGQTGQILAIRRGQTGDRGL